MKTKPPSRLPPLLLTVCLLSSARPSAAQGAFTNLDFEAVAVPPGFPLGLHPFSELVPGWTGGPNIYYDGYSSGGALVAIEDLNYPGQHPAPLRGNNSLYLAGGGTQPPVGTGISQTGLVPIGSKSLTMDMTFFNGTPIISLGGQTISMVPLTTFPTYTVYGGDISSFAGQDEQLSIFEPPPANRPPSILLVDDIQFSPTPVPEPGTWALLAAGGLLLTVRRPRKK
jgi:hypothetical protein